MSVSVIVAFSSDYSFFPWYFRTSISAQLSPEMIQKLLKSLLLEKVISRAAGGILVID